MLLPKIDCFTSIGGLTHHSHVCLPSDERYQPFADNAVIIGDEHIDTSLLRDVLHRSRRLPGKASRFGDNVFLLHNIACSWQGRTTTMLVPLPRWLLSVSVPPICSTRSRIPVRPTPSFRSLILNPSPSSFSSSRSSLAL